MTVKSINYTGRKKIPENCIRLETVLDPDGNSSFSMQIDNEGLGFDPKSRVLVQAYNKEIARNFDFGTLESLISPRDTTISDLGPTGNLKFRIKVFTDGDPPVILGRADGISVGLEEDSEDNREGLITVRSDDIGSVPWKIEFPTGAFGKPVLILNVAILNGRQKIKTNHTYQALVLPTVIHQVMQQIVSGTLGSTEEATDFRDEPESWQARWVSFVTREVGVPEPDWDDFDDLTSADPYLDEVVEKYCDTFSLLSNLVNSEQRDQL